MEIYASYQGISRIERAELDCDAELLCSRRLIRVNRLHSPGRQNFSVAHEIVHTLISEVRAESNDLRCSAIGEHPLQLDQSLRAREEEMLCNHGAAELLMPMEDFVPRLRQRGPCMASVSQLAQCFGASREALLRRIASANLWPCAGVVWELCLKPTQFAPASPSQLALPGLEALARPVEKLRVRYAVRSDSFGPWIPRHKSVCEDTSVFSCFSSGESTKGWDVLDLGGRDALRVYAQSMPVDLVHDGRVKERRVLTLLLPDGPA